MIELTKNSNCTGCGMCISVCNVDAISIIQDEKGMYKPCIDPVKCIKCGKCTNTCPVNNFDSKNGQPIVYAFINKDNETRMKSASGGAFPFFAKYIINKGGTVFGVEWDEEMKAGHTSAKTYEELEKMYTSKYVQSNTKNTFKEAKELLDDGKLVLFSGTPCQIGGLKSFLNKDYDNLITIDIVCHGTSSPLVFEKYKKEFLAPKVNNEKILSINLRSKVKGWGPLITTITTAAGTYHIPSEDDEHMAAFLPNLSLNDSCLNCQFNKIPRTADISIGDFWGVDEFDKSLNDKKGTSIILLNSEKSIKLFDELKENCVHKEVPLDFAVKYNPNILRSSKPHKNRDLFFKLLTETDLTLAEINKKCIKRYPKILVALFKIQPKFIKTIIKKFLGI